MMNLFFDRIKLDSSVVKLYEDGGDILVLFNLQWFSGSLCR